MTKLLTSEPILKTVAENLKEAAVISRKKKVAQNMQK